MEGKIKRTTPDLERAKSLQKMTEVTLERIKTTDKKKFLADVTEDYYSVVQKLIAAILLTEGKKAEGKGAHALQIRELGKHAAVLSYERELLDLLRQERNKIEYEGHTPAEDFLERNEATIRAVIKKLKAVLEQQLRVQ